MSEPRLSKQDRENIVREYLQGDKIADIARKWGVDQTYPRILAKRRGHSDQRWRTPRRLA